MGLTMAGSDYTGGAAALIWAGIGLVIGTGMGWYFGPVLSYAGVGLVLGWLGGLALGERHEGGDH